MNFFRLIWGPALSCILFILVVWLIVFFVRKWSSEEIKTSKWVDRTGLILTLLSLVTLIIFIIQAAGVNMFPRSVIDRSGVDQQNQEQQK